MITGNRERIDADLAAAGIRPGDPRLTHGPADVGLPGEPSGDAERGDSGNGSGSR
ncbi:MAG: hypothetical protein R2716_10020 [Microthrixaceae bacterium]